MYDRMQTFSKEELSKLHDSSLKILQDIGIAFHDSDAIEIFKKNGFKVDGKKIKFTEKDVIKALETTPSNFTISARNPQKNIQIGLDKFIFLPGFGGVFIISGNGEQRNATIEDYDNFCKLAQTSKVIDMNSFAIVTPSDVPPDIAHLEMLYSNITLCDMPIMGSAFSKRQAIDSLEMASIAWGGKDKIRNKPVMFTTMSGHSPLQWSGDSIGSLIEMAKYGQPCVVRGAGTRGSTMPITLSGSMVVQNAMALAALILAQLVNPGTPIVYGGAPVPSNMKNASVAPGLPEYSMSISAVAQMARFYNLPSRENGAVTDAHIPDYQAGMESALLLSTCVRNGININLTSCGLLSSFMAASFEKYVLDEELCGIVRQLVKKVEVTDESIALDEIKDVGIGGEYLATHRTVQKCRTEFYMRDVMNEKGYDEWKASGKKSIDNVAEAQYQKRISQYNKPDIDPEIEKDLRKYIIERKM
jgi:trimethylamine---corrinoid protein Co-methyltransferase